MTTLHIAKTYYDEVYRVWVRHLWVTRNGKTIGTTHVEAGDSCGRKMRELAEQYKVTDIESFRVGGW